MSECYDVVMPILKRDWTAAKINLPYVFRNLPIRRLVVVSGPELASLLPRDERIAFVNENELVPGLTLRAVKKIIYSRIYTDKRAGWYFQQFIKMAYARICTEKAYVVWDADTIPVRSISYMDGEGRFLFTLKEEYNPPYFETIRTLLGLKKQIPESFIAENMIFDTGLMRELLDEIEGNSCVPGTAFWEKILMAVPEDVLKGSGFSEFETFGTWVMARHPDRYATRQLATLRSGKNILGAAPSSAMLDWVGQSYDTVSMEKFSAKTPLSRLAACESYRAKHSAAQLEELKNRFHLIPAVYRWGRGLWPRFRIWGGACKRRLRVLREQRSQGPQT